MAGLLKGQGSDPQFISKQECYDTLDRIRELVSGLRLVPKGVLVNLLVAEKKLQTRVDVEEGAAQPIKRHKKGDEYVEVIKATSLAIWEELGAYLKNADGEASFHTRYIVPGHQGYIHFRQRMSEIASNCVLGLPLGHEEQKKQFAELDKVNGWIDNAILNLVQYVWTYVAKTPNDGTEKWIRTIGNPAFAKHKQEVLSQWSELFKQSREDGNIRVKWKTSAETTLSQWKGSRKLRPFHALFGERHIAFIDPTKMLIGDILGSGVYGEVHKCTVMGSSYILETTTFVCKRFTSKVEKQNRKSAVVEAIMGALQHKGIIGALAMTIDDPPMLLYDYYNGGMLGDMMDAVQRSGWPLNFRGTRTYNLSKVKLFMISRLAICFAILETMEYFHNIGRVHTDLHLNNIMLHFYHTVEGKDDTDATQIFVGICDFGCALYTSQAQEKNRLLHKVPKAEREAYLKLYTQIASECIDNPRQPYSAASDVYALGHVLDVVLNNHGSWDKTHDNYQKLSEEWNTGLQCRLHAMVLNMRSTSPGDRKDVTHWVNYMLTHFPGQGLHRNDGRYLRD